ncbi:MAG: YdcF family protein [Pseudomonadota bacterium]
MIAKDQQDDSVQFSFRSVLKFLTVICALFGLMIGLLYFEFTRQIRNANAFTKLSSADAIVVLTGEAERLYAAVGLLGAKFGERLLISGVDRKISADTLEHHLPANRSMFNCCIDLDYHSMDTSDNAKNTSYWADIHRFDRLIIVTSDYHMPRSLLVMRRAMPEVELVPVSVPVLTTDSNSLVTLATSPVVLREFSKYLIANLGLEQAAEYLSGKSTT